MPRNIKSNSLLKIFAEHITTRLTYVLDFCFKSKGADYQLMSSVDDWQLLKGKHLNYSGLPIESAKQIRPEGILFESEIYPNKQIERVNNCLLLDGVEDHLGLIFYFLTQYEDYFCEDVDQHGRVPSSHSSLVRLKLNKTAVVDRLVQDLWNDLELDYEPIRENYSFLPTFDIDIAWAYKQRSFVRSIGAAIKGGQLIDRIKVGAGIRKDPYDTYDVIRDIATKTDGIYCFVLLGDYGPYDKNIHWENNAYGSLIRGLNLEGEVGIHPSYASFLKRSKVAEEKKRLVEITGHNITASRQHFMRVQLPHTYQVLCDIGIEEDYSVGFADQIGFKAGTAFPFYFFDLKENNAKPLKLFPFMYMDSALKDYLKYNPNQAIQEVKQLINEVKEVGGVFSFIWHNSSINNLGEWKDWRMVLDETVKIGNNIA